MRNIFTLTRAEQRVVIFIVVVLVAAAFTQHLLQTKSRSQPARSILSPTASPTVHPEEKSGEMDESP